MFNQVTELHGTPEASEIGPLHAPASAPYHWANSSLAVRAPERRGSSLIAPTFHLRGSSSLHANAPCFRDSSSLRLLIHDTAPGRVNLNLLIQLLKMGAGARLLHHDTAPIHHQWDSH